MQKIFYSPVNIGHSLPINTIVFTPLVIDSGSRTKINLQYDYHYISTIGD